LFNRTLVRIAARLSIRRLQQWYAHQQDTAMEAQYARAEDDVIGPERKAWRAIRRSAAKRRLSAT